MKADRLVRMVMLLQRRRHVKAADLAGELQVSERTILRDVDALAAAGVPVWAERGPRGGIHLMEGWRTPAGGLTPAEAQALFGWSARESARQLGLDAPLASALAKVAVGAPAPAVDSAERLGEVVLADRRRWFAGDDEVPVLPVLRAASAERQRLHLTYSNSGQATPTPRIVDPVGLVDHSGRWYLTAESEGEMRMFRVSRVASAEVIDGTLQLRDRRPLSTIWAEMRARFESGQDDVAVTLAVDAPVQERVRRLVRMMAVPDTGIEVLSEDATHDVWSIRVRHLDVLVVMSVVFAATVEVRDPPWIAGEIVRAAHAALTRYGDAASE